MKTKTKTYRIYILRCPMSNEPRYVGMTTLILLQRLKMHMVDMGYSNKEKHKWIQSLKKKGEFPIIELRHKTKDERVARQTERKLIEQLSKKYPIFNIVGNPILNTYKIPSKYIIDTLPKIELV